MLPNAVVVVYLFSAFFWITRGLVFACARALNEKRNLWRRVEKKHFFLDLFFICLWCVRTCMLVEREEITKEAFCG